MDEGHETDAPPVLYLPVSVDERGDVTDIHMLQLEDGRVALLAYTALDRLVECCGEGQPWAVFETRRLVDLYRSKPFDVKLLDLPLPTLVRADFAAAGSC